MKIETATHSSGVHARRRQITYTLCRRACPPYNLALSKLLS